MALVKLLAYHVSCTSTFIPALALADSDGSLSRTKPRPDSMVAPIRRKTGLHTFASQNTTAASQAVAGVPARPSAGHSPNQSSAVSGSPSTHLEEQDFVSQDPVERASEPPQHEEHRRRVIGVWSSGALIKCLDAASTGRPLGAELREHHSSRELLCAWITTAPADS